MKFVKSGIGLVLAVFIFLNTLIVPLIYLDFETRKEYISEVLCINKAKPMTICGGKCYLTAQLNNAQQHTEEQQSSANQLIAINFYFHNPEIGKTTCQERIIVNKKPSFIYPELRDPFLQSPLQPPKRA